LGGSGGGGSGAFALALAVGATGGVQGAPGAQAGAVPRGVGV